MIIGFRFEFPNRVQEGWTDSIDYVKSRIASDNPDKYEVWDGETGKKIEI